MRTIRRRQRNKLKIFLIAFGVVLCLSTLALPVISKYNSQQVIQTFKSNVEKKSEDDLSGMMQKASEYNSLLYQTRAANVSLPDNELLKSYDSLLDFGNEIMGTISIPKISLEYPIYHGTSNEVLSKGIGHMEQSSLPVGGESTHAVLSGHRGLPTAKMFTRLDELKQRDLFFINVGNETLAYQVSDITVVKPDDMDVLNIAADKDQVSLVTCTPYGINSHRLIVTGDRIPYTKEEQATVTQSMPSWLETGLIAAAFLLLFTVVAVLAIRLQKEPK